MKTILLFLFGIIMLSLFSIRALFYPGFFDFHDDTQVARVFEMTNSLEDGLFPVRWVEHLGYGYGYPLFNFYAPLAYYFGSVWIIFGLDALSATKIMFGFGILLSAVTMFFLSRKFFGNAGGLVSAIVYLYFPYHAVNIYVRGAVSEFFAYAFLPIIFYGIFSLFEKKVKLNFKNYFFNFLLISSGVFFVAISHNLSFMMLMLLLVPTYFVGLFFSKIKFTFSVVLFTSVAFGILLSSFYAVPAFFEMGYTNVQSQVGGGADFKDHYVCLNQLWNSNWGFGGSVAGCNDGMSFKLGKVNILILILSTFVFAYGYYKKQVKLHDSLFIGNLLLLILSLFLTTSSSYFIWQFLKPMEYIQYPWRFLNFAGLFISIISGFLIYKLFILRKELGSIAALAIIILTIFLNANLFTPQTRLIVDSDYYTNIDTLTKVTSKVSDEYLPKGSTFPLDSGFSIEVENPSDPKIRLLERKTGYFKFEFMNDRVSNITFNYISHFPSWKAYFNGERLDVIKSPKHTPKFSVPGGDGILELKFEQTAIQTAGNIISIIAFLLLFIGIIYNINQNHKKNG